MRSTVAVTVALLLALDIGMAEAADLTELAEGSGFLLGNAYRCGVPTERVERVGKVIHNLIADTAYDSNEETAAATRFASIFLANAFPDHDPGSLIPPCKMVITQFKRLEQHHRQAGMD